MQYMLLIYSDESSWPELTEEERGRLYEEYGAFTEGLRTRGAFVAGDQLQPVSSATTVRVHNGEQLVTDGPFAETKEQLGGFYIIEADSIDGAIAAAAMIPAARTGSVEVRPLVPMRVPA